MTHVDPINIISILQEILIKFDIHDLYKDFNSLTDLSVRKSSVMVFFAGGSPPFNNKETLFKR